MFLLTRYEAIYVTAVDQMGFAQVTLSGRIICQASYFVKESQNN
jgi:hypothetical protein